MFAPHCPCCGCQVLLGIDRIVRFAWNGEGDRVVVLRCVCGELLDWDQHPSARQPAEALPLGA